MAAGMQLHLDRVHFGLALPGSVLEFAVRPGSGFVARAALDCNLKTVASWEFVELQSGQPIQEPLLPPGTYTLQVDIAFTDPVTPVPVAVQFALAQPLQPGQLPQHLQPPRILSLTGVRPDIGRALASVFIQ